MLLWLIDRLTVLWPDAAMHLAAFGKITLRAALAAMASFLLAVLLGPKWIGWLSRRFHEPQKSPSPEIRRLHESKRTTPTMGGLFIVAGLVAGSLLFGDLGNRYLLIAIGVGVGMAAIGAIDDLVKLRSAANGISARTKLAGQLLVAGSAATVVYFDHAKLADGLVLPPPLHGCGISLGAWFIPLAVLVIVGSSNAVNLTDGLDGLAGGCLIFAVAAMTVVVYASGHAQWAAYLLLPRIPGCGELTVLAGAMIGGVAGFLWFNCHPAQVFMGDTGALSLGGLLGLLAVVARQELLLVVVGGVFVAEAASVILQVGSYRLRRRRVFRCAPLHHHFQFKGWPENKIVVRFWIAAALCALVGLAGLKVHVKEDTHAMPVAGREAHLEPGSTAEDAENVEGERQTDRTRGDRVAFSTTDY
jgi:phospho-N-acetylmuramoyl-pentapeptide-transferase